MKVKTFWLILLKIIGFTLIIKGVNMITFSITTFSSMMSWGNTENIIWGTISIILIGCVYFFILWLFVFKTSWLIDKFSLEKGFEEEKIEINAQILDILSIAIIVIGGIILIDSLPQFCKQIFTFFYEKTMLRKSPTTGWIILYFAKAILGYLLMTNSKPIVSFMNKKTYSNSKEDNELSE